MICVVCKRGEPQPGTATKTLERQGTTLVVQRVPAQVCPECGEAYFDEATTARLLELVQQAERAGVSVATREYAAA